MTFDILSQWPCDNINHDHIKRISIYMMHLELFCRWNPPASLGFCKCVSSMSNEDFCVKVWNLRSGNNRFHSLKHWRTKSGRRKLLSSVQNLFFRDIIFFLFNRTHEQPKNKKMYIKKDKIKYYYFGENFWNN